jgi:hypothetical protein
MPTTAAPGFVCSLAVPLAPTEQRQERHNEHLYKCCNEHPDSTGRIVPTLSNVSVDTKVIVSLFPPFCYVVK